MDSAAKGHGHGCSRNTKTFTPPCTLLLLVARAPVPLQRGALTRTQLQHFASRGKGRMNQESCASFLPDKWGAYPSGASGQKY